MRDGLNRIRKKKKRKAYQQSCKLVKYTNNESTIVIKYLRNAQLKVRRNIVCSHLRPNLGVVQLWCQTAFFKLKKLLKFVLLAFIFVAIETYSNKKKLLYKVQFEVLSRNLEGWNMEKWNFYRFFFKIWTDLFAFSEASPKNLKWFLRK